MKNETFIDLKSYEKALGYQLSIEEKNVKNYKEDVDQSLKWPKYAQAHQITKMHQLKMTKEGRAVKPGVGDHHQVLCVFHITINDLVLDERCIRFASSLNADSTMKADIVTYSDGEFIEGIYFGGETTGPIPKDILDDLNLEYKMVYFTYGKDYKSSEE